MASYNHSNWRSFKRRPRGPPKSNTRFISFSITMLESHEIENFPSHPSSPERGGRHHCSASSCWTNKRCQPSARQHRPPALQQRHFKMRFLWRQVSLELNLFTIIFKLMRWDAMRCAEGEKFFSSWGGCWEYKERSCSHHLLRFHGFSQLQLTNKLTMKYFTKKEQQLSLWQM